MTTESQIRANRKNAQKSTGPRTPRGKARSARNATTHGLTAATDVIKGESPEEFDAHREALIDELAPETMIEQILADHLVSLAWQLRRVGYMHNQLVASLIADRNIDPNLTLGCALKRDFSDKRTLERFVLYERRIQNSFIKSLHELERQKRKTIATPPHVYEPLNPPLPFSSSDPSQTPSTQLPISSSTHQLNQNAQNEPNGRNDEIDASQASRNTYNPSLTGCGARNKPSQTHSAISNARPEGHTQTITRRH